MIAASASNRSVMSIDSAGSHCTSAVGSRPGPGQLSATQTRDPSGTNASG
jgi:hypothetical protein